MDENHSKTLKILIGVIIGLSTIIFLSGVFYILNMQNKIIKLETEREEQLKRQVETQNMASVQSVQSQPNTKKEAEVKTEPKVVKAKINAPKPSYEKVMINRMRPVENELNSYIQY